MYDIAEEISTYMYDVGEEEEMCTHVCACKGKEPVVGVNTRGFHVYACYQESPARCFEACMCACVGSVVYVHLILLHAQSVPHTSSGIVGVTGDDISISAYCPRSQQHKHIHHEYMHICRSRRMQQSTMGMTLSRKLYLVCVHCLVVCMYGQSKSQQQKQCVLRYRGIFVFSQRRESLLYFLSSKQRHICVSTSHQCPPPVSLLRLNDG